MAESFSNSLKRAAGIMTSSASCSVGITTNLITGISTVGVAVSDFIENHDLLAVGTHSFETFNIIKECHGKYPDKIVMLSPTEAELLKYYSNVFNALRIIFANEFYEICNSLNADYNKVKDAFILRRTTTDMYLDVNKNFRGYGGVCLPKDTAAIASLV